jgi:hypothetical protein
MITVDSKVKSEDGWQIDFNGLSTDTKPTEKYGEYDIANGSSFFELDTQQIHFYDADSNTWK